MSSGLEPFTFISEDDWGCPHQRSCSESLIMEKPSWLDDLLDEPETTSHPKTHRRSVSDSQANHKSNLISDAGPQAKQYNNAHRSRVRKLHYIAHLERTAQIIQGEGCAMLREIQFREHQNMMLSMENGALRHRLDNISHEQMMNQWEQEMLEREIMRLRSLHHLQQQGHEQQRRRRARDLDQQMNRYNSKGIVTATVQA